jgi:Photosynthesis system II assembly factor YCF48
MTSVRTSVKAAALATALLTAVVFGSIRALGAPAESVTVTPRSLLPSAIAFWNRQHGLIGTGFEDYPGTLDRGSISVTTDGGRTSHVLVQTPGPVVRIAVARPAQAWAIVRACKRGRCSLDLWRSSDAGRTWQVVRPAPPPFYTASFADAQHGFALVHDHRLIATTNAGRTWRRLASPCPAETKSRVSLVSPGRGWLLCLGQPGAGNQEKTFYRTDDAGTHWQRLSGGFSYGYPQGIAFASDGLGVMWESRGTLYLTRHGGRHWTGFAHVSAPEADFGLSASVVPGRAFALLWRTPVRPIPFRLVATTHDLTGWRTVRTWMSSIR